MTYTLQTAPSPQWVTWTAAHLQCAEAEWREPWSRLVALKGPHLPQKAVRPSPTPHLLAQVGPAHSHPYSFPEDLRPSTVCFWAC